MVVVNFILQKGLPFLYGFFHLHKIFYTLNKQPVTAKKETVFSEGKIKTRYILEVETNFKNRSE
ncbi:hypothetical protein BXT96_07530 [Enterococcus faecium]|nr:hypothetical protein AL026_15000 [Enterococcus faecium]APV58149.1 hypothetical protein AL023_13105 [Enterococcus faecium]AUO61506.1 hypothetical protein BXT96_07530 [Enterococcus faecium]KAB7556805.1 hypothetical protein GBM61_12490 [Enterococcus faecium]KAB7571253.1 hypothetical protein GBM56_12610 [Enterococcus faecium]